MPRNSAMSTGRRRPVSTRELNAEWQSWRLQHRSRNLDTHAPARFTRTTDPTGVSRPQHAHASGDDAYSAAHPDTGDLGEQLGWLRIGGWSGRAFHSLTRRARVPVGDSGTICSTSPSNTRHRVGSVLTSARHSGHVREVCSHCRKHGSQKACPHSDRTTVLISKS